KTKPKSRTAKLPATKSPSLSSATATAEKSPPNTKAKSPATPSKAKSNPTGPATGKPSTGKADAGNNFPVRQSRFVDGRATAPPGAAASVSSANSAASVFSAYSCSNVKL